MNSIHVPVILCAASRVNSKKRASMALLPDHVSRPYQAFTRPKTYNEKQK